MFYWTSSFSQHNSLSTLNITSKLPQHPCQSSCCFPRSKQKLDHKYKSVEELGAKRGWQLSGKNGWTEIWDWSERRSEFGWRWWWFWRRGGPNLIPGIWNFLDIRDPSGGTWIFWSPIWMPKEPTSETDPRYGSYSHYTMTLKQPPRTSSPGNHKKLIKMPWDFNALAYESRSTHCHLVRNYRGANCEGSGGAMAVWQMKSFSHRKIFSAITDRDRSVTARNVKSQSSSSLLSWH